MAGCLLFQAKLLLVTTVVALLVYTVSGLVPLRYLPHDHLLIGLVTPEQLRAHEAAESLEESGSPSSAPTTASAWTATGGLVIAVAPGFAGLISALHLGIAIQLALTLIIVLTCQSLSDLTESPRSVFLASPDPPPRWNPHLLSSVSR